MAPSKSDKKSKNDRKSKASPSRGKDKGVNKPLGRSADGARGAGASGARKAASGGGLRVAGSPGSRGGRAAAGREDAGKAGKAGQASKAGKGAGLGNKKAATKARKIAVEALAPVAERPGIAETRVLAEQAIEIALDKKALVPVLIDVSSMASYTDFIAILSGKSDRQVDAIAEGITQFMKGKNRTIVGHEGSGGGRWTLLDFGDVVFHVFYHPVREFYDLESLWVDAPRVPLQVPPEALRVQPDAMY